MFREDVKRLMLSNPHWDEREVKPARFAFDIFTKYNPHGSILDVGCSRGRDAHFFSSKGLSVTGVDTNQEALYDAKKAYRDIEFIFGNVEELPFQDLTFDFIYCTNVIMWTDDFESICYEGAIGCFTGPHFN